MLTRRLLLKGALAVAASGASLGAYAFGIEPRFRLEVTRWSVTPPRWPTGLELKLVVIADIHAGEPYMPPARIAEIVDRANALLPDAILLLGDYAAAHRWQTRKVPASEWASILRGLRAPLGVHAVLGNHDWWDDAAAQRRRGGPVIGRVELERAGIPVYENDAVRLTKAGRPFWIAGLGDQIALVTGWRGKKAVFKGMDDLKGTISRVTDDAPVILMAHEPDIFPKVPSRVALTISGHTHGGQVRLAGYSPVVPSMYGNRYAYGHILEGGRHLVVSGGLGCSKLPVRFGVPPEIVVVELGRPGVAPILTPA
ncbi:MAG: metallophosphoesterase [Hyphomicrobiaceae bacterium]|nr:metallophosphoesterase [Hyphomicrobiaceae bacterium]